MYLQVSKNHGISLNIIIIVHCILFRSSEKISTGNGVYLPGDPHSVSVTELWQAPHLTSSRTDSHVNDIVPIQINYNPLSRVHQPLSRDVRKREHIKPWHQRESKGE